MPATVMLPAVLTPSEAADLTRLADDVHDQPARLKRLHDRIIELYEAHKDDDDPVTMAYLADRAGYTVGRVQQIIARKDQP